MSTYVITINGKAYRVQATSSEDALRGVMDLLRY